MNLSERFRIDGVVLREEAYGEGHINASYRVDLTDGRSLLLQQINTHVFQRPDWLMENIQRVTEYLRVQIARRGGDPERETLRVIPTRSGALYDRDGEGRYWRLYPFISHTVTYQSFSDSRVFQNAGEAFGRFLADLSAYPVETLHEVIPCFHHTPKRYQALEQAADRDIRHLAAHCERELVFAQERNHLYGQIIEALEAGRLPLRVTHNDTKVNNVLMDPETGRGVCVVDLDTVMPGSSLYDFGDAIRFGAATRPEDTTDLAHMKLDLALFEAFARGYMQGAGECLIDEEIRMLPLGALLMTLECGIRFLADALDGDTYFKIHHPGQNLERCRAQFALAADMERKMEDMESIVRRLAAESR